jgi:hypothetical protein
MGGHPQTSLFTQVEANTSHRLQVVALIRPRRAGCHSAI